MNKVNAKMAGPLLPGLPNELLPADSSRFWDSGKSRFAGPGQVEVFHPLTFWAWSSDRFFDLLGGGHYSVLHRTLGHLQAMSAEAHRQGSVEPDFDPHLGFAHAGPNVLAGNLVDLVVEPDRVAVAHLPGFDIA